MQYISTMEYKTVITKKKTVSDTIYDIGKSCGQ